MTKEQEIIKYMIALDISREEAEQLWQDDHDDVVTPEMKEMEEKAKKNRRYEKSSTPRKKVERERKIDPNKLALHSILVNALNDAGIKHTPKNESELSFTYCGDEYTIKLIKHRKEKKS